MNNIQRQAAVAIANYHTIERIQAEIDSNGLWLKVARRKGHGHDIALQIEILNAAKALKEKVK